MGRGGGRGTGADLDKRRAVSLCRILGAVACETARCSVWPPERHPWHADWQGLAFGQEGRFGSWKERSGRHNVVRCGEAASSHKVTADNFVTEFQNAQRPKEGLFPNKCSIMMRRVSSGRKCRGGPASHGGDESLPEHAPAKDDVIVQRLSMEASSRPPF